MKTTTCLNEFLKYSSLSVFGMIGISCYILADTFFVSKGLGTNGLAALNLAIPIYSFLHGTGLMLGMGGGTWFTIYKSRHDKENANHTFTTACILALFASTFFFVIGLFFSETIVQAMGAQGEVLELSSIYLQTILLCAPLFLFNNVFLCFVRNDGAPNISMRAMLCGSLFNIIFDYIFIFPCQMGIFGAALATGLSPVISMLLLSIYLRKKKNTFHLVKVFPSKHSIRSIFSSGLPSFVAELSSGIVMIMFNSIILQLQGTLGIAAYGIIANLSLVVLSIYTGIAQGIQPLLSRSYGSGNHHQVQQLLRYALISVLMVSSLLYTIVFWKADAITTIFNSEHHATLQAIAIIGLRLYFTSCVFAGCNIILSVYFTSTNNALPAQLLSLMRGFIVIIPITYLLSSQFGMNGVWCSLPITELLVCGLGIGLYLRHRKNHKCTV